MTDLETRHLITKSSCSIAIRDHKQQLREIRKHVLCKYLHLSEFEEGIKVDVAIKHVHASYFWSGK